MSARVTRAVRGCITVSVAAVLVTGAGAAVASPTPGRTSPNASTSDFTCTDGAGTVLGGGVMTTKERTANGRVTGWVVFEADNGTTRRYIEHYTLTSGTEGDSYREGTLVTPGDPLYGDWLYIDGTAAYAPGGFLASYSGTAVDICQDLGY